MKEVLIWEQGGVTNMVFTRNIIAIREVSKGKSCNIELLDCEEPMQTSLTISEICTKLDIDRFK